MDKNLTNDRATQNIAVKGYASPDGPVKFNDTLSKKRSESGKKVVAKLLKDAGLDIDAAAYGEDWDSFKEAGREVGHQGQRTSFSGVEPLQLAPQA